MEAALSILRLQAILSSPHLYETGNVTLMPLYFNEEAETERVQVIGPK